MMKLLKGFALALVVGTASLLATAPVNAQPIEIEIVQLNLTGTGSLPLGFDAGGFEDYGFVDSLVGVSLAPGTTSMMTTTVVIDPVAPLGVPIEIIIDIDMFLQVTITDDDAGADFTAPLPSPLVITPTDALSTTIMGSVDFSELAGLDPNDPFAGIPVDIMLSFNSVKVDLGVDVNNNGPLDFFEFTFGDFFLNEDDLTFDFVNPIDPFSGLIITGNSLTFSGQVADVDTDPPFSLQLSTPDPQQTVPEPATIGLFSLGVLLLGARRRC